MSATAAKTILVADDDPDLRDILRSVLEPAGYAVIEAPDGEAALKSVRATTPDLMILDYMMPRLTGPQVCEQLRQDMILRHVPIIMLTGKSEVQDKIHGIDSGADDYLTKPFEPRELLARVQMVLRRTMRDLEANPLTKLPGNVSIQRELERRIGAKQPFAACYIDLNRFKGFNDHYGFKRGDEVILRTGALLLEVSRLEGSPQDFVGHIGGDDFFVITSPDCSEPLCAMIVHRFDEMVQSLYDQADRERGYIMHQDRKGHAVKIPILSISIAIVTSDGGSITHSDQVAKVGAELKAYAKQFERSAYVKERRAEDPERE